ncbi:MAG: PA0069 family radical SAM protein [Pseudomonadota bacterium]
MRDKGIVKGRGATLQIEGRFENIARETFDDGWGAADEALPSFNTTVTAERARTIIMRNDSPDIPLSQSINAYRGCEHGCIYCYARPSHGYLNLSPGLDFETKLFVKPDAAQLLRAELAKPSYRCEVIALGSNTDPYQPIEREWKITRQILEVLCECAHPVAIVTKSALVERDLDLLVPMAQRNLARVYISVTTLDSELARKMEPRASSPRRRLEAIKTLNDAGVPCGVMVAPIIPFLTDAGLEDVLEAAHAHGAREAGYTLVRLPYEVKDLFRGWLAEHYPLKAAHVMSRLHEMRGGRDNDPEFGSRMRGLGPFADLLAQRFRMACERLGFNGGREPLDTDCFERPLRNGQLELF